MKQTSGPSIFFITLAYLVIVWRHSPLRFLAAGALIVAGFFAAAVPYLLYVANTNSGSWG